MDTEADLQERLRDAGFSPRQATSLARAATGHEPDSDAGASPLTTADASTQAITALDNLRFPVGPAAARRRAELWGTVFPAAIGDGGSAADAADGSERGTFPSIAGFCLGILALAGREPHLPTKTWSQSTCGKPRSILDVDGSGQRVVTTFPRV